MAQQVESIAWVGATPTDGSIAAALGAATRDALAAIWPSLDIVRWDLDDAADALRAWPRGATWRRFNEADTPVFDLRGLRPDERWVQDLAHRSPGVLLVDAIDTASGRDAGPIPTTSHRGGPLAWSLGLLAHQRPHQAVPTRHRVVPIPLDLHPGPVAPVRATGAVTVAMRGVGAAAVTDLAQAIELQPRLPILAWRFVCQPDEVPAVRRVLEAHPVIVSQVVAAPSGADIRSALDRAAALVVLEDAAPIDVRVVLLAARSRGLPVVETATTELDPEAVETRAPRVRSKGPQRVADLARAVAWIASGPQGSAPIRAEQERVRSTHDAIRSGLALRALIERAPRQRTTTAFIRVREHVDAHGGSWLPSTTRQRARGVAHAMLLPALRPQPPEPLERLSAAAASARGCVLVSAPKSGTHLGIRLLTTLGWAPGNVERILLGRELPSGIGEPEVLLLPGAGFEACRPRREIEAMLRNLTPGRCTWGHVTPEPMLLEVLAELGVLVVHIVRDPRAVVRSMADWYLEPRFAHRNQAIADTTLDERVDLVIGAGDGSPGDLRLDQRWSRYVEWMDVPTAITVRYEDLVGPAGGGTTERQHAAVAAVARRLGLSPEPEAIAAVGERIYGGTDTFRVGQVDRWSADLRPEAVRTIERALGDRMDQLGYPRTT